MKRVVRNILSAAAIALVAAGCLVLVGVNREKRAAITCTGLSVHILDDYSFVTDEDVKGYLQRYYGPYIGQRLDSVRLFSIENILNRQSAVLRSEAWTDNDGVLHIDISQREPVLRLQMRGGGGFYVDERGCLFPLQRSYTSLVPVVDGAIPLDIPATYKGEAPDAASREWIKSMLDLARYMKKNRIWKENISQISVQTNGDLVLIPREGEEKFIFGDCSSAEEKFERISDYYKFVVPAKKEEKYRTVNVKYAGQIICRKH